ncbi:tyrosine-type recombinase/integrase [Pararhizobium sp.]|uniref:tyrosine-type recombinase/integrase n=1 Tax=Pararhizobium sp. TaxID=1977563 RepID=UPI00271600D5|nr:tyrosine-type recombinase/integrase [Pararhizobium sp.]MDO9416975.1 tyrosine-type recombinase/integrase [Pararhizobium sp.]
MNDVANIDLPYVEKNKTRHHKVRYYLRIDGKRICRLPNDINSEEFSAAYWKARKAAEPVMSRETDRLALSPTVKPGSFRWLSMEYMRSQAFTKLDVTTRDRRRNIMESMWLEPITETDSRLFADMPYSKMDYANISVLRDRKQSVPFAADERLKVLRQIFDTKRDGVPITPNVARLVEPFRVHSDGHETATSAELEQFIAHHKVGSKAVLYLSIQMFTGFRVSDLALIGPQHRRRDAFKLRLFKNRNRTPVDIEIPLHPILESVLDIHKITGMTYLRTEFDKAFSVKGLGNRISDWFRQAGLPHLTSHSVRKGLATDQAHNEATDSMLEAMFGWKDGKTSKIYTRNADRARLARHAVSKISWDGVGTKLIAVEETETGVAQCGTDD